ncbi:MAG: TetR family transcriptional regulator C-terminal domain-containing protein [Ilumatobacteraceae bacterium]
MKKPTVAERRNEILETTCEVVIERGFAGTRIADVAKRLEVSSSLIHYHFDSKEQLLAEAFAHYANKDVAEMEGEIESAPTALGKLERVIQNYVPEGSDDVEWMLWIDGWGEALRNPMMKKISQQLDEQSTELLARIIRIGVESGEFACPDPNASAMRLTALVDGLAVQFAAHDGMMNRDQLIEHVRFAAGAEIGVALADFGGAERSTVVQAPSPATDAALRHLISGYSDAVTRGDVTAWSKAWDDDATWSPNGAMISGRTAIVAAFEKVRGESEWVVQTAPLMVFEIDEVHGSGIGRVTVHERFKKRKNAKPGTMLAIYHDQYVRHGGSWLFADRRLEVIERS